LLASFTVALGLLELTSSDLIEAHADQVVGVNLRNCVCFFDELVSFLADLLALVDFFLLFKHVQLVSSEDIHGLDSLFLVLEQVAFLDSVIEAIFAQGFTQDVRKLRRVSLSIVHQGDFKPILNGCFLLAEHLDDFLDIARKLALVELDEFAFEGSVALDWNSDHLSF